MVLKGLLEEYKSFVVTTQCEKQQTFREFKVDLRSFEDTERAIATGNHSVMKTEYKQESQPHVTCFQCGKLGHIARFCYSKDKGKNERGHWCNPRNTCHNSSHNDNDAKRTRRCGSVYLGMVVLRVWYFEHAFNIAAKEVSSYLTREDKSFTPLVCWTTQLIQYVPIHNKNSVISWQCLKICTSSMQTCLEPNYNIGYEWLQPKE